MQTNKNLHPGRTSSGCCLTAERARLPWFTSCTGPFTSGPSEGCPGLQWVQMNTGVHDSKVWRGWTPARLYIHQEVRVVGVSLPWGISTSQGSWHCAAERRRSRVRPASQGTLGKSLSQVSGLTCACQGGGYFAGWCWFRGKCQAWH